MAIHEHRMGIVKMTVETDEESFLFNVWFREGGTTWGKSGSGYYIPREALVAWFGEESVKRLEQEG